MCVICIKNKGVEMPSRELLKAMYNANREGCGFCTPTMSYKGLSFDTFMKKIQSVRKEEPCLIHFRLATNGSVRKGNCHPFYDKVSDTFFMHNGILSVPAKKDMTDSETAFREYLQPIIRAYGLYSKELKEMVSYIIGGSRFAFMQGEDIRAFGDFKEYKGLYFSNLRFMYYLNL